MKKINIILVIIFLLLNSLRAQTFYVTYQHCPLGAGIAIDINTNISPFLSIDAGKVKYTRQHASSIETGYMEQIKASVGLSVGNMEFLKRTRDVRLISTVNYNIIESDQDFNFLKEEEIHKISCSIGFSGQIKHNIRMLFLYDIINKEPKIGLGIQLNYNK